MLNSAYWNVLYLGFTTPVEYKGDRFYFKREDLFSPFEGSYNGSKFRSLMFLLDNYVKNFTGSKPGVIAGAVSASPQHAFVSELCKHLGIPCVIVSGTDKGEYLDLAKRNGAIIVVSKVGYAKTLQALAFKLRNEMYPQYYVLETNITLSEKLHSPEELAAFHDVVARQVNNIPYGVKDIYIPAGSCNTATSVIYGLIRQNISMRNIYLFGIGGNGSRARQYCFERLWYMEPRLRKLTEDMFKSVTLIDLNGSGYCKYADLVPYEYQGIQFHPRYEGKVFKYIRERIWNTVQPSSSLFWIVGGEVHG